MRRSVYSARVVEVAAFDNPVTLILQVFDAGVSVHFSKDRTPLERVDGGGNPEGGFVLVGGDPPFVLDNFFGVLYARSTANTNIEVSVHELGRPAPFSPGALPEFDPDFWGAS